MNIKNNIKQSIKTKSMVKGSYSVGSVIILGAILVVICLVIGELPTKYSKIDISSEQIYSVGSQTEELVAALDTDVTLYFITGSSSDDEIIKELLAKYEDLSSHIKVETRDMISNPNFVSQYTSEEVSSSSVIVVSGERFKVIDNADMYIYEANYSTYTYDTTGFDGEGQITSAIAYVTTAELPKLYLLEGHGESTELSSTLQNAIEKENLEIETLSLLTKEAVPEDADCLVILSPTSDFSDEETEKILAYLEAGNTAFMVSGYAEAEMPNYDSILENYGVQKVEGIVIEGNANNYYPQYPQYLVPNLQSHAITSNITSGYVLLPVAQGLQTLDSYRSTLTIESLLTTSADAFSKPDVANMTTLEKESADIDGPFDLAMAITETYNDAETKIVVVSSAAIFDEDVDSAVSGGNTEFIVGALSWMVDHETTVSIASKSLSTESLTLTAANVYLWSVICAIVLPIAFIGGGAVIWFRRRRA